jgi:hypothetical protein
MTTADALDLECDQLIQTLPPPARDWRAWFASSAALVVALLCTGMIAAVLIGRV